MLAWFRERAPIRTKMNAIFVLQSLWIGLLGSLALEVWGSIGRMEADAVVGLVAVLSILSAWWMAKSVTQPYIETVERMEALAAGDMDSPIRHTDFRDCVGRMTIAMHVFRENALLKRAAERTTERIRADVDFAMSAIGHALEQLAEGNVAYRIHTPFSGEIDRLREDFNASVVKMQQTLLVIAANAEGIQAGSREIAGAADELSRRTESQAASLEETAAALDGVTATVRSTAEGALYARQVVDSAKGDAEASVLVARDAVRAMECIAGSSRRISDIIRVIDEIAARTNMLALNAGIQAAHAGEAGYGFAIVASEVRELAQRSSASAREIKHLISNSAAHVDRGVELVNETGSALTRIVAKVSEISIAVTKIAVLADDQSFSMEEINGAVTQIDRITQRNAAMVEESTAAIHSMMQDADSLSKMLARFDAGRPDGTLHQEFYPGRSTEACGCSA